MRSRVAKLACACLLAGALTGCSSPLGRQYEYEEQLYLDVDGAATLVLNASLPALVALHGLPIDPSPRARVDRDRLRAMFSSATCSDVRVGQPWIRRGRRFVQVRVIVEDVLQLGSCGPLSWSTYGLAREGEQLLYTQQAGPAKNGDPGQVNWEGDELVAFKLHLPSRIIHHNVRRLEDGATGRAERGNILTWEQRLADRRASVPVDMEVRMDSESILYRTLWLFGGALLAAVLLLVAIISIVIARAKKQKGSGPKTQDVGSAPGHLSLESSSRREP